MTVKEYNERIIKAIASSYPSRSSVG